MPITRQRWLRSYRRSPRRRTEFPGGTAGQGTGERRRGTMQGPPMRLPFAGGALPSGAALLVLRLVTGPILAYHGYRKLDGGVGKFVATVSRYGFPYPDVLARG